MEKINIAVTGASGAIYARILIEKLLSFNDIKLIRIIFTRNGADIMQTEQREQWSSLLDRFAKTQTPRVEIVEDNNFYVSLASGSGSDDALVVVPCSMGMVGRIASGVSDSLITRGADVMLKERKKLILVVRESPFSLIHLRNMTQITEAGGVIVPASPSFYSEPKTIYELCNTTVENILRLLGIGKWYQWQE